MFKLTGKTAIVTGASKGIGQAIAEVFAEAGAHVFLCGLEKEAGDDVAAAIRAGGGKAAFQHVDITDAAASKNFVEQAAADTGRIDILVNNASYTSGNQHDIMGATDEEWNNNFKVGLLGSHYCTQAALPWMIKSGAGSVIVISSVQALSASPGSTPYSSIKAAQLGFVKSAASDYGPNNIRFNAICPGPIQVAYSPKPGSDAYENQVKKTLLGRVGQPREIGHAALFLASDEASFITGTVIPVDGGWTAM